MPQAPKRAKGEAIPPRLSEARLRLTWKVPNEDQPRVIDLTEEPGSPQLRLEILRAFEVKTRSDWRETATVFRGLNAARHLLGKCEEQGVESLTELEPDLYGAMVEDLASGWSEDTRRTFEVMARLLLLAAEGLPIRTAWLLHQRQTWTYTEDRVAYTRDEFMALQRAAQRVLRQAHRRITRAYDDAMEGSDLPSWKELPPGSPERRKRMLWAIFSGEETVTDWARERELGFPPVTDPVLSKRAMYKNWFMLTPREVVAVATLLVCAEGYNLSTIERLRVADLSGGVGDVDSDFYAVLNDKARRGRRRYFTSLHEDVADDPDNGVSGSAQMQTGRVFRLIHEATHPARHYAFMQGVTTSLLLLYAAPTSDRRADSGDWAKTIARDLLSGPPGAATYRVGGWVPEGLQADFQVLHRTFQIVVERAPTHNTRNAHIQSYLAKNPEARAEAQVTTRNGLNELVATTNERMTLRISDESEVGAEVNSGLKDTATVACADITHHPITGEVCRDNFLMCLACSNAIATARHVPRLALLHRSLEDLQSTLTSKGWDRWRDHYLRLHAFLISEVHLDEEGIREAATRATKTDRLHASRVLGGTYDVER